MVLVAKASKKEKCVVAELRKTPPPTASPPSSLPALPPVTASPRLLKTLYKGLLKASSRLDTLVPGAAPASLLPALRATPFGGSAARSPTLSSLVRSSFRSPRGAPGEEARLAAGFSLLREANSRAAALRGAPRAVASVMRGRPAGVHFSVGSVVRHATHGYAGVVLGWTPMCEAGTDWCARNGVVDPAQPFYTVLVDVRDRPEAQVTYVQQSSLQLLSGGGGGGDCFVLHPLLSTHFGAFDARVGAYAPGPELAAAFPCDAPGWAPAGAARGAALARAAAAHASASGGARSFVEEGDDPEPEAEPEAVPVKL